jgi:hypothetical protein
MFSKRFLAGVAAAAVSCLCAAVLGAQPPAARDQSADDKEHLDSTGSGFILTNSGYIATNHHVIAGATTLGVHIPGQEKPVPARVVADDPDNDLAIVKVDGPVGNAPIAFVEPKDVKVGQDVVVFGYPLGFTLGQTVRVSTGTMSSLYGPRDNPNLYQISAPIQPGNSGGPVFNKDGQLVGVVVSQFVNAQNVNFAIKGGLLAALLQRFPDGAEVLRRNTKLTGSREQQVETLSKWVVQILNFRPAISTASREFRRSQTATTRVDLLGGKITYWIDLDKWSEANPDKKGVPQQFMMTRGQSRAGVLIEVDPSTKPIDEMRAGVMKELLPDMPDAQIASQERRIVNGLPMLVMEIDASSRSGPVAFLVQLYSGPEGSIRTSAYTDRRNLDAFKPDMESALSGFEKPKNPSLTSAPFLTEWTRKTLRLIDSPVLMRVSARESDVARYQKVLSAYQDASPQIYIEYIDPEKSVELARNIGITSVGLVEFNYKGRRLRSTVDVEVDVTKALMRLQSGPQKVYFTQVHSERDLAATDNDGYSTLAAWLAQNNFKLERLVPTTDNKIPADAAIVVAAGPKRDFSANQITSLKNYLATGGRLMLLLDPPLSAGGATPNLTAFAREWGIDLGAAVTAEGPNAVAASYGSHPATMGFRDPVAFPTARAIAPASGAAARGAVVLMETKNATPLGAAVRSKPTTAPPAGSTIALESRLVIIGDSDFISNGNIRMGANSALFGGILAWITDPIPPADLSK